MLDNQLLVPTLPTAFERLRNAHIQGIIALLALKCRYRWLALWATLRSPLPRLHSFVEQKKGNFPKSRFRGLTVYTVPLYHARDKCP